MVWGVGGGGQGVRGNLLLVKVLLGLGSYEGGTWV